ncbi:hypothetical protein [Lysobacter sp. M15]|uniref:hypothetical protein n=1 Tax=Lysobacter sp. M15 TaxID=2916837 RepID=UPI001F58D0F2|nr:hypothetical protein [Lysobacter sp. M15]
MVKGEGCIKNAGDGLNVIFSLIDYGNYVRLSGRYARNYRNLMGRAFQGGVPADKLQKLKPGDVLFVQTLGSSTSWLIMYLTSSQVSHFASYIGGGKIIHATTNAGVVIEPIESLFDKDTRVLIAQLDWPDSARKEFVSNQMSLVGTPYGRSVVYLKAYQVLSGRDWSHFRWKFAADVILMLLILDMPALLTLHYPVVSWLIPIYLTIVGFHSLLWKIYPLKRNELTVKPNDMIATLMSSGAALIYDEDFMSKQVRDEIAMLQDYARRRSVNHSRR